MIGEGVLRECLQHSLVTEILSVGRRASGLAHPKLKELIVPDFLLLQEDDERLKGYDACFFCAGVSSVGMKEADYRRISYDTTLHFAKCLGPNAAMSFVYVSGIGTDSSEKGRSMWARVKGKTENDLARLPFKQAFGFRIGVVKPGEGQQQVHKYYRYTAWLLPLIGWLMPNGVNTMAEVSNAMIYAARNGFARNVIQVKDIREMSKQLQEQMR